METKNLFVSHVHEDDHLLQDLKDMFVRNGYDVRDGSIDSSKPNDANNEEYIKYQILAPRISWAGTMVVLISPKTHESPWVNWEIEYAAKENKRIIGVWVPGGQDSDIPESFHQYGEALVAWSPDGVMNAVVGQINNWNSPQWWRSSLTGHSSLQLLDASFN